MASFPFFQPFYPRYRYNYYNPYYSNMSNNKGISTHNIDNTEKKPDNSPNIDKATNIENTKNKSRYNRSMPFNFNFPLFSSCSEEPIFEILGIKLYLDDIIILGILFFLYNEKVQDEMLFLILILLLLS